MDFYDVYMKIVLIIDINMIVVFVIGVFILMIGYVIKIKGIGGFLVEFMFYLFSLNNKLVMVFLILCNLLLEIIVLVVKLFLLVLCLFGNLYVGELIFILIGVVGLM